MRTAEGQLTQLSLALFSSPPQLFIHYNIPPCCWPITVSREGEEQAWGRACRNLAAQEGLMSPCSPGATATHSLAVGSIISWKVADEEVSDYTHTHTLSHTLAHICTFITHAEFNPLKTRTHTHTRYEEQARSRKLSLNNAGTTAA